MTHAEKSTRTEHFLHLRGLWLAILTLLLILGTLPGPTLLRTVAAGVERPVLAFYYPWYKQSSWCTCTMSDLPAAKYSSNDTKVIDRQIAEASRAGITGFIVSWWGKGSYEDGNFATMLDRVAAWNAKTSAHFVLAIHLEDDGTMLQTEAHIEQQLRYAMASYTARSTYFHWQGKPVFFIWDAFGGGRTQATWAAIRKQVDPQRKTFWSLDTIEVSTLDDTFDSMHLFGAGYWGITQHDMMALYRNFRAKVDAYNQAHGTQKLWIAGVIPGYNDSQKPQPLVVPRDNGATYALSWQAAIASKPAWITISTFNQWYLGSTIEPSVHYGTQYLDLTKRFAAEWRAQG